jgi:hypothetical protein
MPDPDSWKIPGAAERCSRCETSLEVGSEVTVVLEMADEGPGREDLCASCGEAVPASEQAFFWRHALPEQGASPPVADYALLREMFERMLSRDTDVYRRLSYLVGLVLIRKRHLRLRSFESRGGREVMIVSRGVGQPEIVVPAPHLDAEALVNTRQQLTRLLAADLPLSAEDLERQDPEPAAHSEADGDAACDVPAEASEAPVQDQAASADAETELGGGSHPELN